jgi:hypothetical protein
MDADPSLTRQDRMLPWQSSSIGSKKAPSILFEIQSNILYAMGVSL